MDDKSIAKIIAIYLNKGGIGKTTTAVNLSACFARMGYNTLLIDTDSEHSATDNMFPGGVLNEDEDLNLYHLFKGVPIQEIIYNSVEPGLDIIPASKAVREVQKEFERKPNAINIIKNAIKPIENEYDFIVFDMPPSALFLSSCVLTAVDEIIIPVHEAMSLNSLAHIMEFLVEIKDNNPDLIIGGILLTIYDTRTAMPKQIKEIVTKKFGDTVLKTIIPQNIRLGELTTYNKSIFQYAPRSAGAKAYKKLAIELLTKWDMI